MRSSGYRKKLIIAGCIIVILAPVYHWFFGIGYAAKEYTFERLDERIWFNGFTGDKSDEENPFPLELNLQKLPRQYVYLDFNGYKKEPNWYNYHVAWAELYTEKEYKTFFLYDITIDWEDKSTAFVYNTEYDLGDYNVEYGYPGRLFRIARDNDEPQLDDDKRESFDVTIPGYFRDTLFAYRFDALPIAPVKLNAIFQYSVGERFLCTITLRYSLDEQALVTEAYNFVVAVEKGYWWNPNAWWFVML
ncbi:hypothetical protein ACYULU_14480 [Breznakiellaceae bacterium SP9]